MNKRTSTNESISGDYVLLWFLDGDVFITFVGYWYISLWQFGGGGGPWGLGFRVLWIIDLLLQIYVIFCNNMVSI